MAASFQVDVDGRFRRACMKLAERHRMTSAQIVTQNALDIAERCFDRTPKADPNRIWSELRTAKAAKNVGGMTVVPYSGPGVAGRTTKAGKFIRYSKPRQLQAIHLIVNAIRGRHGKPGLYGKDMMRYAGKVTRSRRGGAGSLKIAFLPAIRQLMPKAKFKFSWSAKAQGIKRWPHSQAWGTGSPAIPAMSPAAEFTVRRMTKTNQQKVDALLSGIVAMAVEWKRSNVIARAERIQAPEIAEFNR